MVKFNRILVVFISVFLILSNLFILYKLSDAHSRIGSLQHANGQVYGKYSSFRREVDETHRTQMNLLHTQLANLNLEDVKTNTSMVLGQVLQGQPPIVLVFFSPSQCHTCIEHELPRIRALADSIGKNRVAFLVFNVNQEFIRRFSLVNAIDLPFYFISDLGQFDRRIMEADAPYALLVNADRYILKACSLSSSLENWSAAFYGSLTDR